MLQWPKTHFAPFLAEFGAFETIAKKYFACHGKVAPPQPDFGMGHIREHEKDPFPHMSFQTPIQTSMTVMEQIPNK
jgi:hypothetical protein